jgi:putative flippase GtrA
MTRLLTEAIGYAAASGCALCVDMTILWILVHFFSWDYVIAATCSYLVGAVVAYELSVRVAFKQHALRDRRLEFATFMGIGAAGIVVNEAVIFMAVNQLGMHYLVAKSIAAGCTFTCNFLMRRQILFVRRTSV